MNKSFQKIFIWGKVESVCFIQYGEGSENQGSDGYYLFKYLMRKDAGKMTYTFKTKLHMCWSCSEQWSYVRHFTDIASDHSDFIK